MLLIEKNSLMSCAACKHNKVAAWRHRIGRCYRAFCSLLERRELKRHRRQDQLWKMLAGGASTHASMTVIEGATSVHKVCIPAPHICPRSGQVRYLIVLRGPPLNGLLCLHAEGFHCFWRHVVHSVPVLLAILISHAIYLVLHTNLHWYKKSIVLDSVLQT